MSSPAPSRLFFEASWEVCNKVGGIHTVLTTKLPYAQDLFRDGYYAVGPYVGNQPDFHELPAPDHFAAAIKSAQDQGVDVHFGHWLTDGEPPCFLVGWLNVVPNANQWKGKFWAEHGLDTLGADPNDVDPPLLWSTGVGVFIEAVAASQEKDIIYHGHEWLTGGAFLVLSGNPKVKTVFTTHATVLGRALSSRNVHIYEELSTVDPEAAARDCGVLPKHQLERLCANLSTVFTTVSTITGREATAYLGRTPDVITENGVDLEQFPAFDELSHMSRRMREELNSFVEAYFFPSYRFDLRNTLYYSTMGRYETHNKGYDISLEAFGALNEQMKAKGDDRTIIACYFVPGDMLRVRPEVYTQVAIQRHITTVLSDYTGDQQRELYASLWEDAEHCANLRLLPDHSSEALKQLLLRLPTYTEVPASPFDLRHPDKDDILTIARANGLLNREEDRVKVLFFPAYFDGFDGIFNRSLYELIAGCDYGFFPSLYEPWGYTPMESLALGVPGATSDLAGFGIAVAKRVPENSGTVIIPRDGTSPEDTKAALVKAFTDYLNLPHRERLTERMRAYLAIQEFSWVRLFERYKEAYTKATKSKA